MTAGREVRARLVAVRPSAPGEYDFPSRDQKGEPKRFRFVCPCGCGDLAIIGLTHGDGVNAGPHWTFDGDREKPTLTPSIHQLRCGWHGYLTAGIFRPVS